MGDELSNGVQRAIGELTGEMRAVNARIVDLGTEGREREARLKGFIEERFSLARNGQETTTAQIRAVDIRVTAVETAQSVALAARTAEKLIVSESRTVSDHRWKWLREAVVPVLSSIGGGGITLFFERWFHSGAPPAH